MQSYTIISMQHSVEIRLGGKTPQELLIINFIKSLIWNSLDWLRFQGGIHFDPKVPACFVATMFPYVEHRIFYCIFQNKWWN